MDAVMKILKELERQNQAPKNDQPSPQQQKRKKRKEARQQEVAAQEQEVQSEEELQPIAVPARTGWDRQRVVDAMQLMMLLGPPPGLED